jgi:hypothetical protein
VHGGVRRSGKEGWRGGGVERVRVAVMARRGGGGVTLWGGGQAR